MSFEREFCAAKTVHLPSEIMGYHTVGSMYADVQGIAMPICKLLDLLCLHVSTNFCVAL